MADVNKLLEQFLGSGAAGGFAGGLAGGIAGSMLGGKKSKKLSKKALKLGGLAAVGALAYSAYQRYNNSRQTAPQVASAGPQQPLQQAPPGSGFIPKADDSAGRDQLGFTLVRAMIAAARADGTLDDKESQAIFQRIQSLQLPPDERDLLIREMGKPVDMDAIVAAAATPEIASEIYVASLLAIDVDTPAEQSYLAMLAARLGLPQQLVAELHAQVQAETEPAA